MRRRIGAALVRFGLWLMRPRDALEAAQGDDLTRMGALYGLRRETDAEFRRRVLERFTLPPGPDTVPFDTGMTIEERR